MGNSYGTDRIQAPWFRLRTRDSSSFSFEADDRVLFERNKLDANESLDYRQADDLPYRNYLKSSRSKSRDLQKLVAKWFLYFVIGVTIGCVVFLTRKGIDFFSNKKYEFVRHYVEKQELVVSFFVYFSINLLYALLGCVMVLLCGPMAGGSGIPEVKGYLNGVRVLGTINLKTFIGKVLSLIFGYSSCLALGPEGPMVHIGSMVGGGLSAAKSRTLHIRLPKMFERLRNDKEQRDFISSGAAAGLAAAFGAPIGGVLFAIEEASSFWNRELTWRTFFGCMIAAFTVNALGQIENPSTTMEEYGLLSFGLSRNYLYRYEELLAFSVVGILGGLCASLFINLNIRLNQWRRTNLRGQKHLQLLEVLAVVAVSAIVLFTIPAALGHCRPISNITVFPDVCDNLNTNNTKPSSFFCPSPSDYNSYANLFLVPQDRALKNLFSRTVDTFSYGSLCLFLVVYFPLVTVTAGLSTAAGLFVPMMLIGATFGRIIGLALHDIFSRSAPIDPSVYALVGSASMMAGFSRMTISLVVILMELTENTQFLLAIMLAVMCAKWTADACGHALYDRMMELKSIAYLEPKPPRYTAGMAVSDVMEPEVICLNEVETLERIVEVLTNNEHNGFPIVISKGPQRSKTYRGMISRKQLLILLATHKYHQKNGNLSTLPPVLDYEQYVVLMNRKWNFETIRDLPPSETLKDFLLDMEPYMDKSHPVVVEKSSFLDAYKLSKQLD